jgi:hypothetical protein
MAKAKATTKKVSTNKAGTNKVSGSKKKELINATSYQF